MNVYLFGYQKKKNSTKQPALNTGTHFNNVQLKEETSVISPVLLFNPNSTGMPTPFTPSYFNYAYISEFARYYFISDWKYKNGVWECSLTDDVLASFKTAIGLSSAYVERSASQSNGKIRDDYYPLMADGSANVIDLNAVFNLNQGCYVVGIADCTNTGYRVGAITYYAMTPSELNDLLQYLFSGQIWQISSISDITEGLWKSITNPMQYITSCMWMPFTQSDLASGSLIEVKFGYWPVTGVYSKIMDKITKGVINSSVQLPSHPQVSRGVYMNYEPFSKATLHFPPFGSIPIPLSVRVNGDYLNIYIVADCITGAAAMRLAIQSTATPDAVGSQKVIAEASALIGIPITLAQVYTDWIKAAGSLIDAGSSIASGSAAGFASGVGNFVSNVLQTRYQSIGYNGGFMETDTHQQPVLVTEFYSQVDRDLADHGAPLMTTKQISTLSGYIKCADAHFDGACMDIEKDMINGYMESGFYYE